MSIYTARLSWALGKHEDFLANNYSRDHSWDFDGGQRVQASASPQIVPQPWVTQSCVDPEEAFVASLSSCHMLWFLALAVKKGLVVNSYTDEASGLLAKDQQGHLAMTEVTLKPRVIFAETQDPELLEQLHHQAHQRCFIANSVKSTVRIEPQ